MNSKSIRNLTLSAMFAALTFLATTYLKLPIPLTNSGYVHLGDSMIFLAASLISPGYAAASAAIGASLADITVGAAVWAPYTFVIKALMAIIFTWKADKILTKRNILMSFVAGVICMAGYFFAEAIIAGNFITPVATLMTGLGFIQFFGSIILYVIIGYALDKAKVKLLINKDR